MPPGIECATARAQAIRTLESARRSTNVEKAGELIKTGWLASGRTLGKIFGSHLFTAVSEAGPVRTVAASIDYVRALISYAMDPKELTVAERREVPFPSLGGLKAGAEGFREGLKKATVLMRTTVDPDRMESDFSAHGIHFRDPAIERIVEQVSAAHGAVYKPFWQWAFAQSVHYQNVVQAMHEGLRGGDLDARVQALGGLQPTDETILRATQDANYAAFQNTTALGDALSSFKQRLREAGRSPAEIAKGPRVAALKRVSGSAAYLLSQEVIPFTQIPPALAGMFLDYSPLGVAKAFLAKLPPEEAVAAREFAAARSVIGVGYGSLGIFGLGYALGKAGLMTGSYPTDPKEQAEWQQEGKQENSVRIGAHWYNLQPIEPLAFMAIMGTNVATVKQHNPAATQGQLLGTAVASVGKTLSDQPYLMGVQQLTQAMSDPARYGPKWLGSLIPVPPILGQIARGVDPVPRQVTSTADRIQSQIPFLSRWLPPRLTQFGQPLTRPGGLGASLLNPATATKATPDAVTQELDRLNVYPGMPGKNLTIGKQKVTRSPAELNQTLQQFGPILQDVLGRTIQSPGYQALDDDQKKLALEKIFLAIRGAENAASKGRILPTVQKFGQNPNPYYKGPTP